jgi:hypothetical protein
LSPVGAGRVYFAGGLFGYEPVPAKAGSPSKSNEEKISFCRRQEFFLSIRERNNLIPTQSKRDNEVTSILPIGQTLLNKFNALLR